MPRGTEQVKLHIAKAPSVSLPIIVDLSALGGVLSDQLKRLTKYARWRDTQMQLEPPRRKALALVQGNLAKSCIIRFPWLQESFPSFLTGMWKPQWTQMPVKRGTY